MLIWSWDIPPELPWLIGLWDQARAAKRYATADGIRTTLAAIGINLIAQPNRPTTWEWAVGMAIKGRTQ